MFDEKRTSPLFPNGNWQRVTRESLCPICGKDDWCMVSTDGNAVICPRTPEGAIKDLGEAGYLHILNDQREWSPAAPLKPSKPPPPKLNPLQLKAIHKRYRRSAQSSLTELAKRLGLHVDVLDRLEAGYCELEHCWGIPERDETGTIIGLQRRYHDNTQRRLKGGTTGLTYAHDWDTGAGPLVLVEGASDTAAGMMLGLSVIGRPSNRGGVALLGKMLASFPDDRDIVVIGERDEKADGLWPGKDGAIHTATELANRLERIVHWALPPDDAKDLRAWVNKYAANTPETMGEMFLEGMKLNPIHPPPIQRAPSLQQPEAIPADSYREQMLKLRQRSLDAPGIYLDRSGTGHGKSSIDYEFLLHELGGQP